MAKLDPEIYLLLADKAYNDQLPPAERRALEDPVNIRIQYQGELAALQQLGFDGANISKTLAVGRISLEGLEQLSQHPDVVSIERLRRLRLDLNDTVPRIKADLVRSRSGSTFSGLTGNGVIIGIIDSGIDFRHNSFIKADDQTTRILKLWDQTRQLAGGESRPLPITDPVLAPGGPIQLNYGVEYTAGQINDNLRHDPPQILTVQHVDEGGHGTMVAGIAAGDGSRAGNCRGTFVYVGVAPEADLIVVRKWGLTDSDSPTPPAGAGDTTLDAIRYILQEARALNRPVVINMSFGSYTGDMDGESQISHDMDQLLTDVPNGFVLVCSAGNQGNRRLHVHDTVTGGSTYNLGFTLNPREPAPAKVRMIRIRYSGNNLRARVISPLGTSQATTAWAMPGAAAVTDTNANGPGGQVRIVNQPDEILVRITPPNNGANLTNDSWTIQLGDTAGTATSIHAFITHKDDFAPHFNDDNNPTPQGTLNDQASTRKVITVGNYNMSTDGLDPSSSRGMTLDLRLKPEIVAPGNVTVTTASNNEKGAGDYRGCCCDCCEDAYKGFSGTSAATPHITGVVALIMQQNPTWTSAQIIEKLVSTVEPKPAGLPLDDDLGWGVGMVNAQAATSNGGGGGGGGGGMMAPSIEDSPLNQRLRNSGRSHEFTQLFRKYFFEIRALINSNKRVATVWHRNKGPAWIKAAFRAVASPALPLPFELEGRSLTESIQHMLAILKRYGSPMLVQDMEKYAPEFQALREGMNLFELIDAVDPLPHR